MMTTYQYKITRSQGFTLLEILIAMVIIALMSGVIVMQVGNYYLSNRRSDFFAQQMLSLIDLAKTQAILSSSTIGLQISANDYIFLMLDDSSKGIQWKIMNQSDVFWKKHLIPNNIKISYQTDTAPIDSQPDSFAPQIIIFASGEITPFVLLIRHVDSKNVYTIKGTYTGHVTLENGSK